MTDEEIRNRVERTTHEMIAAVVAGPPEAREDQASLIAVTLLAHAAQILIALGGTTLAAQEFYATADHLAAPVVVRP